MNFVELLTCSLHQTLVLYLVTITNPLTKLSVCSVVSAHACMKIAQQLSPCLGQLILASDKALSSKKTSIK